MYRRLLTLVLTLTLLAVFPGQVHADTLEPNGSTSSAYAILVGSAHASYISSSSDVDYFRLSPSVSGRLTVNLSVPASVDYTRTLTAMMRSNSRKTS